MSRFRPIDRETDLLLPQSVLGWLPESCLARYVVDVVEGLDSSGLERAYTGRGSRAHHLAQLLSTLLLSLLICGYATGTHFSRKIERATCGLLVFRFIACDQYFDRDTLPHFGQCHNAKPVVNSESMSNLRPHLTQAGDDKELIEPALAALQALPTDFHHPQRLLTDTGYFSGKNVEARYAAHIKPLITEAEPP